jgi:two-component system, LytTR family, sensor kinase
MPPSLNMHEPTFVNTLGHGAGMLLFGYLLVLLMAEVRERSAKEAPVLPAFAAFLALVWNAGSLMVLGLPVQHPDIPSAISFSALSLLPAVLLSIALPEGARVARKLGWIISLCAVLLHLGELFGGDRELHRYGLLLILAGFGGLTAASVILAGRQRFGRVLVPIALLLFAASFGHFAEPEDQHLWSKEVAIHHAGIPLAIFVVLQDYRFLLADVFVRGLARVLLAAAITAVTLFVVQRGGLAEAAGSSPFLMGLVVLGACCAVLVFSALRGWMERWLDRTVFQRGGLEGTLRRIEQAHGTERQVLEEAARALADHVHTQRWLLTTEDPGELYLPGPARLAASPWAEAAVPLRFAAGDAAMVLMGRRQGGRRYLSRDFEDLSRLSQAMIAAVERLRSQEQERMAARAELRALQAQINPHFLFNSLNALYGSIPRTAGAARKTVLNLSDIFRYFLQNERSTISIAEELRIVRAYLDIEQLRLGDRMRTEFEVDESAVDVTIPALSIQPLVENAVKHGITPYSVTGVVRLEVCCVANSVEIRVRDTGKGFGAALSKGTGVGLDNVRQRLRMSYGAAADISIEEGPSGTSVSFQVPRGTTLEPPVRLSAQIAR